jgi:tetratricopeptide (TPR) repeat protein
MKSFSSKVSYMPRLCKADRRSRWIASLLLAFIIGAAGLWWMKSRSVNLIEQGIFAYATGDFSRADVLARQRLKVAPDDSRALRLAGRAAARLNRDQNATSIYSRLELSLMTAEDYYLLGRSLSRTAQDDSALKSLEAARTADPDRPEMLDELAQVYDRKDRAAAAEEIAEQLVRRPGWEARGQLMLGTFRAENNDPVGAARALQRGFELDPAGKTLAPRPVAPLQRVLVRSLLQTGQPGEARRNLKGLLGSGSDPMDAWLLSRCFIQEKNWEQAGAALKAAGSFREVFPSEPEPAPFVGALRCAKCHDAICQSHMASRHATTFSQAREPQAFALPNRPVPDPGDPAVTHTLERRQDGIQVETRVGDQVCRALAQYAFGSPDHYVTLVGPDDQGQSRMIRISFFRSPKGAGYDVSSGLELHPAHPDEFLGKPLDNRDGQRRCLSCHTTNFRSILDQVGPESTDRSIGCEACHGPGGNHVLAVEAQFPDPAIISPKSENGSPAINLMCGRCHGLTQAVAVTGPEDDPGWLRFQTVTLSRSRCYSESDETLNCVTCHDPHANAEKSAAHYETKCLSCHDSSPALNSRCPVSPAKGCLDCHMPKIWVQATHAFKSDHNIRVHRSLGGPK